MLEFTFYQYPGPVFGAGAAGAVFRNIALWARSITMEQIYPDKKAWPAECC